MRARGAGGGGGGGRGSRGGGGVGRGRCFPLDRLLRMHDESSQTNELTRSEGGEETRLPPQTFFPEMDGRPDGNGRTEGQTGSRGPVKWLRCRRRRLNSESGRQFVIESATSHTRTHTLAETQYGSSQSPSADGLLILRTPLLPLPHPPCCELLNWWAPRG